MFSSKGSKKGDDNGLVAVAIDKDKNSQYALRWAIDQLLSRGRPVILIHVVKGPCPFSGLPSSFPLRWLFPPDFCTVYVVSKSKLSSVRNATRPVTHTSPLQSQIESIVKNKPTIVTVIDTPPRGSVSSNKGLSVLMFCFYSITYFDAFSENYSADFFQAGDNPSFKPENLLLKPENLSFKPQRDDRDLARLLRKHLQKQLSASDFPEVDTDISFVSSDRTSVDHLSPIYYDYADVLRTPRLSNSSERSLGSFRFGPRASDASSLHDFSFVSRDRSSALPAFLPVERLIPRDLDHTRVAVKVLRPDACVQVEILSSIRHPNLVLLLGACPEYGCLVYEYMANGSLHARLFRRGNTPPLGWQVRFRIAADITTGLHFLHQTKPEPLVHRDLKPGNILLDRYFVSKIGDVGLARLVPPSVADQITQYCMTSTAGTYCYIDPEYQQTGLLSVKSDVYSLGVVLLQLLTAKSPMGLAPQVESSINKGAFAEILDPFVPDWPLEEALSMAKIAIQCAQLRRKDRPDLGEVLPELDRLRDFADDTIQPFMFYASGSHSSP